MRWGVEEAFKTIKRILNLSFVICDKVQARDILQRCACCTIAFGMKFVLKTLEFSAFFSHFLLILKRCTALFTKFYNIILVADQISFGRLAWVMTWN